jgi:hypothetical protein
MIDDFGYRKKYFMEKVKIPEDSVKCRGCGGTGDLRIYYGPAGDRGQFQTCWFCHGKGYVSKEWAKELDERQRFYWKSEEGVLKK